MVDDDCKLQNMIDGDLCAVGQSVSDSRIRSIQSIRKNKNDLGYKGCNGYNVFRYAGGTYIFQ